MKNHNFGEKLKFLVRITLENPKFLLTFEISMKMQNFGEKS